MSLQKKFISGLGNSPSLQTQKETSFNEEEEEEEEEIC